MAIYRFEAKIVSRSGGRSAVGSAAYRTGKCATASAAYRAGQVLVDERTGQRFDYSKKRGVLAAEILLPPNAPAWMRDRAQLWNAVEKAERRFDAQLARDFVISLPHELTHEERVELTKAFVYQQFVAKGYVADIAWHAPEKRGDDRNYHAHVLVTLRRALQDGFAKTKDRPPPGKHPASQWQEELLAMRVAWAEMGTKALQQAGHHLEADRFGAGHMTLDKQREAAIARGDLEWAAALDREPEPKQGPLATKIEKDGRESHAGNDRREVKKRNAELAALKAEHAELTAEIISLELERIKRGHMDELTDDILAQQPGREAELLERARKLEERLAEFRRQKEEEAKEARRQEEERKRAEAARAKEGEIADARTRYAQALGESYDVRDPYGSLARAAMAEYIAFNKQQQEYRKQEAAEQDPDKRRLIALARQIEAHDYMAITSDRCARIGDQLAGPDAETRAKRDDRTTDMTRDRRWAGAYRERATELRHERTELAKQQELKRQQEGASRTSQQNKDSPTRKPEPGRDRAGAASSRQPDGKDTVRKPDRAQSSPPQEQRTGGSGSGIKSGHDYFTRTANEHAAGVARLVPAGKEMDDRVQQRLSKLSNVSEIYRQHDAAKAMQPSRSRGRSR